MKKIILILICLISTLSFSQKIITGLVVKIKDGDTVVVLDSTKTMHTVRLAGVDCPEKKQDYGVLAKTFVSDLIYNKKVKVEILSKDMYGRNIGFIYIEDKNVSEELLRNGLAWHYVKYSNSKKLQLLENYARQKQIGIWSKENPTRPWEFRKKK